jgi:hypothetical protein
VFFPLLAPVSDVASLEIPLYLPSEMTEGHELCGVHGRKWYIASVETKNTAVMTTMRRATIVNSYVDKMMKESHERCFWN